MIALIDKFLNRITMYRLVLYYLIALLCVAFVLCLLGLLPYDPASLAFSAVIILAACWAANRAFAWAFKATPNIESVYITALILALIISPVGPSDRAGIAFLLFASVWAMASKYMLAIGKRHFLNPAAFAVALAAFVIGRSATWWVGGNLPLMAFVVAGGLLVVRKVQRFDMVLAFAAATFAGIAATSPAGGVLSAFSQALVHSPFFFFAFVMLTEPLTTPPNRALRIAYGALVGALFAPNVHVGSLYLTPELALLIGNVFAYIVSPKGRFVLTLKAIEQPAQDVYDFIFAPDRSFRFRPGQYMEWTLGHRNADDRGNRRYFTIASSPGEGAVRLGVKFYPRASTFKQALAAMNAGDTISASHLSGGFVLPKDPKKKIVLIAGGIGITPFRSMLQDLLDRGEARPIVLFYSNRTQEDAAYRDVFERAERELGIRTVYAFTNEEVPVPEAHNGMVDAALIAEQVPDHRERTFYISGPRGMVEAFQKTLRGMGVSRFRIKTDFFPGLV